MREKFTKGPWKATYDSQLQAAIEIYNTEDRIMVAVLPDRGTIEAMSEIEANANLIAAAPDMYEALETTCEYCIGKEATDCPCERCITGKALRKARGEEQMEECKIKPVQFIFDDGEYETLTVYEDIDSTNAPA